MGHCGVKVGNFMNPKKLFELYQHFLQWTGKVLNGLFQDRSPTAATEVSHSLSNNTKWVGRTGQ